MTLTKKRRGIVIGIFWAHLLVLFPPLQASAWELISDTNGIKVESRSIPGEDLLMVRGTTVFHHPIEKVFTLMIDHRTRKEWVDRLSYIKRIKELDGKLDAISHYKVNMPWPVKDRDFVVRTYITYDEKGEEITSHTASVQGALPPSDDFVRALSHDSTVVLKKLGSGKTRITMQARVDPKGNLPVFLVNYFQKRWASATLVSLASALDSLDIVPNKAYDRLVTGEYTNKPKVKMTL